MKAAYKQKGDTIDFTNVGDEDIHFGDVVIISKRIGIAATDIPVNTTGTLHLSGVFLITKTAESGVTEAMDVGDVVYFEEDTGVTKNEGEDAEELPIAGTVTETSTTSDLVASVLIN